jgi:hypothetical protein
MLNSRKPTPLLLLILFLLSTNACWAAEVLQLVQHTTLGGIYDIYVNDKALKLVNRTSGFVMYSRAPSWQLLICNPARKVYCVMPCERFTGKVSHAIGLMDPEALEHLKWGAKKKETLLGLPVIHSQASLIESEFRRGLSGKTDNSIWRGDYFELDQRLVPATVCHAVQCLYGLPLRNNIPLRVSYFDYTDKANKSALDTFICKRSNADMNYAAPTNFKKVATEMDVCAVNQIESEVDYLIRPRSPGALK